MCLEWSVWVCVSDQNLFIGWVDLLSLDLQVGEKCMLCYFISCVLCVIASWGFNSDNGGGGVIVIFWLCGMLWCFL